MKSRLAAAALTLVLATGLLFAAGVPAFADHPSVGAAVPAPAPVFQSSPPARWQSLGTFVTGNPHTDLDFFTQGGETFVSVGTLGNTGANSGGQTILQLTEGGQPESLGQTNASFVAGHPSAFIGCPANPLATLGLQHDVEATPKGDVLFNTHFPGADRRDAQLLLDASDAPGRCHDGGSLSVAGSIPRGGIEIVDITDVANPVEIGLTSHIGEAHTVNVDPRRPHIVYVVTSDSVARNADGSRSNETGTGLALDGFEVMDISSCMNFAAGTSVQAKRDACRPEVYRYRYPTSEFALGTIRTTGSQTIFGCHELEIYPEDKMTCGSGNAMLLLDIGGAFNSNGTPTVFTDDRLNGRRLPCRVRPSTSVAPFQTGAMVTDCVVGQNNQSLGIPGWQSIGSPSLAGVTKIGAAHHQGRGGGRPSTEDNDFNHESEFTHSRNFIMTTDERGGGVIPPGATCATGVDNVQGNGGVQAHAVARLDTTRPSTFQEADDTYARTPSGDKAIFRATPRTGPEATTCTAHVFQQIPGQNRIFMGWYSQGTQVIDYIERPDGSFEFVEVGYFIPLDTNQWVSHIFQVKQRASGRGDIVYYGVATSFKIDSGRNEIEIFKVTLPPPAQFCRARSSGGCQLTTPPTAPSASTATADVGLALAGMLVLPAAAFVGRRRRRGDRA
jgi:hypothetical protein